MDYDNYMNEKLKRYTADHIKMAIADNRKNLSPFVIDLCNVDAGAKTMKQLEILIPTIKDSTFPINIHEKCCTEAFPRERLIYLSPYSPYQLDEFNSTDIFVLPAVIDDGQHGQITLAKAKRMGLRTAYLPLSRYLSLGSRQKALPLNILTNILLDFKNKRDWRQALNKHVPARKLRLRHGRDEVKRNIDDIARKEATPKLQPLSGGSYPFKIKMESDPNGDDHIKSSKKEKPTPRPRLINIAEICSKKEDNKNEDKGDLPKKRNPFK